MSKKPGVGYQIPPGSVAIWLVGKNAVKIPIDLSAEVVTEADAGGAQFARRYGHPNSFGDPQGFSNELIGNSETALINWFAAQPAAHRAQWDGVPTFGEVYDLAFTEAKGGDMYRTWWWPTQPGSSVDRPILVTKDTWKEHGGKFPRGAVLGLTSKQTSAGYTEWYKIEWLPEGFPPPAPPPATGAAAEFWSQDAGRFVPGKVKSVSGTKVKFTPDAGGGSVEHDLDDEGQRWRLVPALTPAPPPPPPTPSPPTPTPKPPEPKPEPPSPPLPPLPPAEDKLRAVVLKYAETLRVLPTWFPKNRPNQKARAERMRDDILKALEE